LNDESNRVVTISHKPLSVRMILDEDDETLSDTEHPMPESNFDDEPDWA